MRTMGIIAALATLLAVACGDGGPADPAPSISGTYVLHTIDGQALPLDLVDSESGDQMTVHSGSMTLTDAGTFTMTEAVRFSSGGSALELSLTGSGTYTRNGATLTFNMVDEEEGPTSFTATISGNTVSMVDDGVTFVFRR